MANIKFETKYVADCGGDEQRYWRTVIKKGSSNVDRKSLSFFKKKNALTSDKDLLSSANPSSTEIKKKRMSGDVAEEIPVVPPQDTVNVEPKVQEERKETEAKGPEISEAEIRENKKKILSQIE